MTSITNIVRMLDRVEPDLREILLSILEEIERQREKQVTKDEFNELKSIVKELAEAQKRSEQRITRLEKAVEELAEAQKRTEQRVEELAEAQKRTEQRVEELAEAQKRTEGEIKKLAGSLRRTRQEVGGLAKSVAYALENEAFRRLPEFLKKEKGIDVTERFIRAEIRGEEINLFARARRKDRPIVLVGESVLKLDDLEKLRAVMRKVEAVEEEVDDEIVPIVITHFAKKKVLDRAEKKGIIVVQSFQW